jgi:hypothetical protein
MNAISPPSGANVSELLEAATRLFRVTLLKCLPLAMLALLVGQIANFYWLASGHTPQLMRFPDDDTWRVLTFLGLIGYLWFAAAMMLRQRALIAGPARTSVVLEAAARRLPTLVVAVILSIVALGIGLMPAWIAGWLISGPLGTALMLLLAAPNVFLVVCYVMLMPIVLFEQRSPYQVVIRAVQLVRPIWVKVCAALLIAMLIVGVCVFAAVLCIAVLPAVAGNGAAVQAIVSALALAVWAVVAVFLSALYLVLYSIASNSA